MAGDLIWTDKKRWWFGLPWTFTRYTLTTEKLITEKGFLNKREEEVRLYRILDLSHSASLGQRMFGLGTIHICSADKSTPEFDISRVKDSKRVKELISDAADRVRKDNNIVPREYLDDDGHEH